MMVINTQWLYQKPCAIIKETRTQIVAIVDGAERRFWKHTGYQLGWRRIASLGGEWDRIVSEVVVDDA